MMKGNRYLYIAILLFTFIAIFFVLGVTHAGWLLNLIHGNASVTYLNKIGTFGDSAGLLNALFSSLAFGGVLLTIFWQVTENRKQRSDEHRIQFENVFFNMTNTLEKIVSELKVKREEDNVGFGDSDSSMGDEDYWESDFKYNRYDDKEEYVEGREVFKYIYEEKQPSISYVVKNEGIFGFEERMTGVFDSYFRYLYRILKYIHNSQLITDDVKYQYAGILRAHLSYMELPLIYYNGLSVFGQKKMKPLIERYHLLKNIRDEKLHDNKRNAPIEGLTMEEMYDSSAWDTEKMHVENDNNVKAQLFYRIIYAILLALIFNTLVSDWWHNHINIVWKGMNEVVVRGLVLISISASIAYFQIRDKVYKSYFITTRKKGKLWIRTWNKLQGNYLLPVFLFLIITSLYTTSHYQMVWYDTHTIYLDLSYFYFPLLADVFAIIVNVVREADWEEKEICKQ